MKKTVGILNFNYGNIKSIERSLSNISIDFKFISTKEDLKNISHLIIPGVGSFKHFMSQLRKKNMINPIKRFISQKPVLAICLGMQILFTKSEEFGTIKGLNILKGTVKKIDKINPNCIVPNIGYLKVRGKTKNKILEKISNKYYYFAHSYACFLKKKYNHLFFDFSKKKYIGLIYHKKILATQFHPELSKKNGLNIYKYFLNF